MSNVQDNHTEPTVFTADRSSIAELRKYRIFGIALFDLLLSLIGVAVLFNMFGGSWQVGMMLAIPIGIVTHLMLSINTTLNYYLGLNGPVI